MRGHAPRNPHSAKASDIVFFFVRNNSNIQNQRATRTARLSTASPSRVDEPGRRRPIQNICVQTPVASFGIILAAFHGPCDGKIDVCFFKIFVGLYHRFSSTKTCRIDAGASILPLVVLPLLRLELFPAPSHIFFPLGVTFPTCKTTATSWSAGSLLAES